MRLQDINNIWLSLAGAVVLMGAPAKDVNVPKGTDVPLVFDQTVSSKTAKAGDRIAMHVAESIHANGATVIHSGTKVWGIVTKVEKRKHFGVSAKLRIAFEPIHMGKSMIDLEPKDKGKYTGSRSDKAGYAAGGGALLLGPVGLAGGYFVVGKPVNIKVGDTMMSEVSRDTVVSAR